MKHKLKTLSRTVNGKLYGNADCEISGMSADSRFVKPGDLFVVKKGAKFDGSTFIPDAIQSGAKALLTDLYSPFLSIPQIVVSDLLKAEAKLAATLYSHPSKELLMIGITGTNGKTTSCYLIKHLLEHFGIHTGLLGTIEQIIGALKRPAALTTNDVITNHRLLHEMRTQNCRGCVMEVSSHALAQKRVDEISFDLPIFTNLSQDHLDYHGSMEEYLRAKSLLFSTIEKGKITGFNRDKRAIVNIDSPATPDLLKECPIAPLTYGFSENAELRAQEVTLTAKKTKFTLTTPDGTIPIVTPLIGRFNIENTLAALSVGYSLGLPLEEMAKALKGFPQVPGRLERVKGEIDLFVDYAHTPEALSSTLKTLRELTSQKIITVFGCGGDRDRSKRPLMGKAVEEGSDFAIVTSDNPRSEDPQTIVDQITTGMSSPEVILDRTEAIHRAVEIATSGDIVLIAGKGHETYQIFAHQTIDFDDRLVAKEALESRKNAPLPRSF